MSRSCSAASWSVGSSYRVPVVADRLTTFDQSVSDQHRNHEGDQQSPGLAVSETETITKPRRHAHVVSPEDVVGTDGPHVQREHTADEDEPVDHRDHLSDALQGLFVVVVAEAVAGVEKV